MSSSNPEMPNPGQPLSFQEPTSHEDFKDPHDQLLSCPKCHHFISGADIDIEKTIATCGNCHHVFGFSHDSATGQLKPEKLAPQGIEVLKLKSELDIRLDWKKTTSTGGRNFILLFTTFWNLILLPFVLMILLSGNWGILLFMSLHLLVGLGLIWYLASIYMNTTSLSITPRKIRIRTFPLRNPLFKAREIDTGTVKQFYVSRYTQSTTNGVPNYAYALYAILGDGEKVSLLRGMNLQTQQYLEGEIEQFLGIEDIKVEDEVR